MIFLVKGRAVITREGVEVRIQYLVLVCDTSKSCGELERELSGII